MCLLATQDGEISCDFSNKIALNPSLHFCTALHTYIHHIIFISNELKRLVSYSEHSCLTLEIITLEIIFLEGGKFINAQWLKFFNCLCSFQQSFNDINHRNIIILKCFQQIVPGFSISLTIAHPNNTLSSHHLHTEPLSFLFTNRFHRFIFCKRYYASFCKFVEQDFWAIK